MKFLSALVCGALVAGCGLRGDLERAPPLWGEAAKAEYQREQAKTPPQTPKQAQPRASDAQEPDEQKTTP
jgi:hypothetical protein